MRQLKAKRDESEPEIIAALKGIGAVYISISMKDVPDLLCSWCGHTFLIECKSGKAKLKPGQEAFKEKWQGLVLVARCAEDVINFINTLDK